MADRWKVVYDLLNGAIFNDLEWPLSTVSRSRHSLTLNISDAEYLWIWQQVATYLGFAEVEVHAVVDVGDRLEVKVTHTIDFQLERQRRFQVTVNTILLKLYTRDWLMHSFICFALLLNFQ